MLNPKRIHEFDPLLGSEITEDTVIEIEKPVGGTGMLLLEDGDKLLLEDGDGILFEEDAAPIWVNYKITYAELLARIISDLP